MSKQRVYIFLDPSRVEAALVRGKVVVKSAFVRLDPSHWREHWSNDFGPLDVPLQQVLGTVGASGKMPARVSYQGLDTVSDLITTPSTGDTSARAARMAMADRLQFSLTANPYAQVVAATDKDNGQSRTHHLAVAERNSASEVLCDWLHRAGLVPEQLIPSAGIASLGLIREVVDNSGEYTVRVHAGVHETVIAGAMGGKLVFVRHIGFGIDLLIDAIRTSCNTFDDGGGNSQVLRSDAEQALLKAGIPGRNDEFPIGNGVAGATLLPALQPVLQRYSVELRQTLRFGFGESGLVRSDITLTGVGARIPNFANILTTQLEVDVQSQLENNGGEADSSTQDGSSEGIGDDLAEFIRAGSARLNLLPASVIYRSNLKRLRSSLRVGAAVAAAVLVADLSTTWSARSAVRRQAHSIEQRAEELRLDDEQWEKGIELGEMIVAATEKLGYTVGDKAPWEALLAHISRSTESDVRLTEVTARTKRGPCNVQLRGYALDSAESSGSDAIGAYVRRMSDSPLVESIRIGSTGRGQVDGLPTISFELTVMMKTMRLSAADLGIEP